MKHHNTIQSDLAKLHANGYELALSVGLIGIFPRGEEPTFDNTRVFRTLPELMAYANATPSPNRQEVTR